MFRTLAISLLSLLSIVSFSCEKMPENTIPETPQEERPADNSNNTESMPEKISITVSVKSLPIKIEDNETTRALVAALREGTITYEADDYGGFEKVGSLGRSLPRDDKQITTQAGDVILYSGSQIVLFYGSNAWSYTRIGKMEYGTLDELKSFLKAGQGKISVSLSYSGQESLQ